MRVNVGWPFKGNNQGLNAASERSDSANEDILMFFFQLDLATRVQVFNASFLQLIFIVHLLYSHLTKKNCTNEFLVVCICSML